MTGVWVSDLSLVLRTQTGKIEGLVTRARSGEPIQGAEIFTWSWDNNSRRATGAVLKSDANGLFPVPAAPDTSVMLLARFHGQEISPSGPTAEMGPREQPLPEPTVIFFTDRAIYRPGQLVQFKGLVLLADQDHDNYKLLPGPRAVIVFNDLNGKEIARQKFRANAFGSFAGSFTAPRDRLTGAMILQAQDGAIGQAAIRIEEYKRPKFEVTLDAPAIAPKLGAEVLLTGHALSYTGAAVDAARVTYHIQREARWPAWLGWWRPPQFTGSQLIAHGTATTAVDGSFKIAFKALPDLSVPEKDEPSFVFTIQTDVTDSAGETRSARRELNAGYTALRALLVANDWQTSRQPLELTVRTETLDREPQPAVGIVKIYALQSPPVVARPPLTGGATNLADPNTWTLGRVVAEKPFSTGTNGEAALAFPLRPGAYRATLETHDRFDKKVTAQLPVQTLDPDAAKLAIKIPHLLAAPQWKASPAKPSPPSGEPATPKAARSSKSSIALASSKATGPSPAAPSRRLKSPSPKPCAAVSPCTSPKSARTAPISIPARSKSRGKTRN